MISISYIFTKRERILFINRSNILKQIISKLFLCLCILSVTKAAFAEGGAQFPGRLYTYGGARMCNWSNWCHLTENATWNAIFAYVLPGDTISVTNFGNGTVFYPNGTSSSFSNSITIDTALLNIPGNGDVFEFRSSSVLDSSWDITVKNEAGEVKNGRIFSYGLVFSCEEFYSTLYTLTDEGVIFQSQIRGGQPWHAVFISTKRGIFSPTTGNSIYHSKSELDTYFRFAHPSPSYTSLMPDYNMIDSVHKTFFNYPDPDLLSYLGLSNALSGVSVQDFKFVGNTEGYALPENGGVFSFTTDGVKGNWQLSLNFGNASKNINYSGVINKTSFSIPWDGKDKQGNYVPEGSYTATLTTSIGETHFIIDDYETGGNGFVFTQMNGKNQGSNIVYYDNTRAVIEGKSIPASGNGDNQSLSGIDSSSGILRSNTDEKTFDVWMKQNEYKYDIKFMVSTTKEISIRKVWSDADNRDGIRPGYVQFNLFCGAAECGDNPYTITEDDNWTITVPNIPIYDSQGQENTYSVVELGVN